MSEHPDIQAQRTKDCECACRKQMPGTPGKRLPEDERCEGQRLIGGARLMAGGYSRHSPRAPSVKLRQRLMCSISLAGIPARSAQWPLKCTMQILKGLFLHTFDPSSLFSSSTLDQDRSPIHQDEPATCLRGRELVGRHMVWSLILFLPPYV
jgi:hypothetical protein